MNRKLYLNGNDWEIKDFVGEDWIWRNSEKEDTRDVRFWRKASVPGSIQHDLLVLGEIPDPYYGRNSLFSEWVSQRTWIYRKKFFVPEDFRNDIVRLIFKGIDYEASVYLNGYSLGSHKSMFIPAEFDVADKIRYGQTNFISVVLEKAPDEQPQVSKTGYVKTHKCRMTYWWDFCPRMIHMGIWQDVYLESCGKVRIEDCFIRPRLIKDFSRADIDVSLKLQSLDDQTADIKVTIAVEDNVSNSNTSDPGACVTTDIKSYDLTAGDNIVNISAVVFDPLLWHSNGRGPQNLYRAKIEVSGSSAQSGVYQAVIYDSKDIVFGIRNIRFVPNDTPDKSARPYTVEENGERVYIKGWNWVPADVMYGAVPDEKYTRLIRLAKNANVNMFRVWGGGLIEKEIFYDLCDRNGIMIWQEFIQSSSGIENKPSESAEFLDMMRREAESIIPQKRNHPSLVMWCGGNELSCNGVPLDDSEPVLGVIGEVVRRLDPDRHWQPTSPQGPVFGNTLENIKNAPDGLHDVHGPWEFQGLTGQQTLYNAGTSLLSSEFGVEGMASYDVLARNMPADKLFPPDRDNIFYFHRGAWWNNYRMVQESFGGMADNIQKAVLASRFLQAEGLRYAVESNRRRQYRSSGTLPWQFNEPFPNNFCTSAVDYYTLPKPAYYTVGRAYNPILLSASFETMVWAGRDMFTADIWASNSTLSTIDIGLSAYVSGYDGVVSAERQTCFPAEMNSSRKVMRFSCPIKDISTDIFFLTLHGRIPDGSTLAYRYIFSKGSDMSQLFETEKANLDCRREDSGKLMLINTGRTAAIGIFAEEIFDDQLPFQPGKKLLEPVIFGINDNYIHLLPGEKKHLYFDAGLSGVRIRLSGFNFDDMIITQ